MLRFPIATVYFLFISAFVIAQQSRNYHVQQYNTDQGLPSNGIKGLQWDEGTGFLWIATEAGISRFNGLDFKNFTKENTSYIASERMLFLIRNNAGQFYTADMSGNIIAIAKNRLSFFGKIKAPVPGRYNKLFTISISDTFYHSKTEYIGQHPFSLLSNFILPISDTSCHIIHNGRLFKYSANMDEAQQYGDTSLRARFGFRLKEKHFVADNEYTIHEINEAPEKNRIVPFVKEDNSPFRLIRGQARFFWTNGTENPIIIVGENAWLLSLKNDRIVASLICDKVPTDALIEYAQYSSKKSMLFLGTNSKGIIIISLKRLEAMKSSRTGINERNAYYSQVELPGNNVLTGEGHVIGNDLIDPKELPIQGKFGYFTSGVDSLLWYSQSTSAYPYNHLNSYDPRTKKVKEYNKVRGSEILVRTMSDGKKLLMTEFGIGYLVSDSIQYLYRHLGPNYNNAIYDLLELTPGTLLIAGCAGILQYDLANKKIDTLAKANGNCFRTLWKYNDYIFLGTYGKGFYIWKNGLMKSMPLDKKKYLLYAHCFMPDDYGYCWISTNRGLFKVNLTELINAYEKNDASVYFHYFGKSDGMEMIEMNGGCNPCAIRLANKTISFPTMDGLLWVHPERAQPILPDGQIYIDEIIADSILVDPEKEKKIILPANTKEILIKLSFAGWCNRENIYVSYQLNDTLNWKPVNTDNDALLQFSNLPSGNYTLRLRKQNGFGINNYSYQTIQFSIVTPWHKKWWFTSLVLLALTGIVFLYVYVRTNQLKKNQLRLEKLVSEKTKELQQQNEVLEKNNSIKTRLISIISHDIVTPLKFLTVAGKNLLEKKQLMSEELQKETISEITNTSQELQLLSTNILNWIKYQNENRRLTKETFNMHEMVKQVLGILNSLAQQKNLRIINEVEETAELHQFYEPMKILVYNLLTNAIHFSEKGRITVRMRKEKGQVIVSVQDEGVGMTPEKIQSLMADHVVITSANVDNKRGHGLGFLIIKDLLKTVGATLRIDSKLGVGTTISIDMQG